MSEASEKVIGVRDLPIFPLSIVLFPGVPLPLHIFEQRYRQMLNDIQVSNNLFRDFLLRRFNFTTRDSASGSHRLCGGGK